MIPWISKQRGLALIPAILVLVTATTGCVTPKPLPYHFAEAKPAPGHGPELALAPAKNARMAKDKMDEVLELPTCLDSVMVKELEGSGLFRKVSLNTNGIASAEYVLEPSLLELRWEVPDYGKIVGTTFAVSVLTGGLGGIGYGATGTDVLGHASLRVKLTEGQSKTVILDREYRATAKDNRAKLSCDTPNTYREMAAAALKDVIGQLKEDLHKLVGTSPRTQQRAAKAN
jgi:hypothetical protein